MPKKKTKPEKGLQKPPKVRHVGVKRSYAAIEGVWRFRGTGRKIKFALKDSKAGLRVRVTFPGKSVTMTERAWRALIKFLDVAMHNARPETMNARFNEFVKRKRERQTRRRRRWRARHRIPSPRPKKIKVVPVQELGDTSYPLNPTPMLLEIAKAKLAQDAKKGEKS